MYIFNLSYVIFSTPSLFELAGKIVAFGGIRMYDPFEPVYTYILNLIGLPNKIQIYDLRFLCMGHSRYKVIGLGFTGFGTFPDGPFYQSGLFGSKFLGIIQKIIFFLAKRSHIYRCVCMSVRKQNQGAGIHVKFQEEMGFRFKSLIFLVSRLS